MPQPSFQRSMCAPADDRTASVAATLAPLSRTWVSPATRGLLPRSGRLRKVGSDTSSMLKGSYTFRQGAGGRAAMDATTGRAGGPGDLEQLAAHLRTHAALRAKAEIGLVSEVMGAASWVHGPGDDGAVVRMGAAGAGGSPDGQVIACGEALLPAFVARDPYGAGFAAVLTNVNDLAAMGAVPCAIVDTIVGSADLAREALRGMKQACAWYDVALAGGHLTLHDGPPALSAFGVGRAEAVLSTTHVAGGQSLIVAACTTGEMRTDFPL